jgi:hypothetical protein
MRKHFRFTNCVRPVSIAIQPLASVNASTRSNVPDPIILNGFVPPKVQRHLDQTWPPCESLGEKQVGSHFLEPDELDLEQARGCRTTCCIDA